MFDRDNIYEMARNRRAVAGIGAAQDDDAIRKTVASALKIGIASKIFVYDNAIDLISALFNGSIDCAVRGTLNASAVLSQMKNKFGVRKTCRAAVMRSPRSDCLLLLAPVGIDDGKSIDEKLRVALLCVDFIKQFGSTPKLGILASGRMEDIGRSITIRKSLYDAKELERRLKSKAVGAEAYGIEIEKAVERANCIIAPDGVTGNFIFRSLHYLGGWDALGAPVLGLQRKIFIDTSRRKDNYVGAVALASAMSGLYKT